MSDYRFILSGPLGLLIILYASIKDRFALIRLIPIMLGCVLAVSTYGQCDMICHSQINLSLNQNCEAIVTPEMLIVSGPGGTYSLSLTDQNGAAIASTTITEIFLDQNLTYHLSSDDPNCCLLYTSPSPRDRG